MGVQRLDHNVDQPRQLRRERVRHVLYGRAGGRGGETICSLRREARLNSIGGKAILAKNSVVRQVPK